MAAHSREIPAQIQIIFNKEAVVKDSEGRTVFHVEAIVCADTFNGGSQKPVCQAEGKSSIQFDYYPLSSGVIIDNWQLVGGVIMGIIVIIITFLCFRHFGCFQKVRYYKDKDDYDENEEMEMGDAEMDEVELR